MLPTPPQPTPETNGTEQRDDRRGHLVTGILLFASVLPRDIMHGPWFAALSMFVAINTVLYLTLAIIKLLPKAYLSDWVDQRNRRSEISQHLPRCRHRKPAVARHGLERVTADRGNTRTTAGALGRS